MDPLNIIAVCALILTAIAIAVGVGLIVAMLQLRDMSQRLTNLTNRLEPLIDEADVTMRRVQELVDSVTETAESAQRITSQIEGVGSKAMQASSVVLGGLGGPLGRTFAILNAVKTGADIFFGLRSDNKKHPRKRSHGRGTKSATPEHKEVENGPKS